MQAVHELIASSPFQLFEWHLPFFQEQKHQASDLFFIHLDNLVKDNIVSMNPHSPGEC
jgi:hypothetical protein